MPSILEKNVDELLSYLEKSMNNLAKDAFDNLEIEGGYRGVENFLQNQFDIRLENLLSSKNSSIHHLESSMKNKIIQKKQLIFKKISEEYNNYIKASNPSFFDSVSRFFASIFDIFSPMPLDAVIFLFPIQ